MSNPVDAIKVVVRDMEDTEAVVLGYFAPERIGGLAKLLAYEGVYIGGDSHDELPTTQFAEREGEMVYEIIFGDGA